MNKNLILWIEALFAVLSMWVLFMVESYPEYSMFALRLYIFLLIGITVGMVIAVRYYQSQHSTVDINRICEMVRSIDAPAFIWSDDLETLYTNEPMAELLGVGENEEIKDSAVLLGSFFHKIGLSPKDAAETLEGTSYDSGIETEEGTKRYISWTTSALMESSKASLYLSIGFETTELEETAQELSAYAQNLASSQNRYQISMRLSGIGMLLCESVRPEYYVSDEAKVFLGIEENYISFADFHNKLHPDDRVKFNDYLRRIGETRPDADSATHPRMMELRISANNDKHYIWYAYHYHENLLSPSGLPLVGGALIDITMEKAKDAYIEKLAYMDEITEIYNRNKLMSDGEELYRQCEDIEQTYWVMVLDIDRFHIINDSYGYENGDKVLKDFAHILCKYTINGGFAARVSADNFVIVLNDPSVYGDDEMPVRILDQIRSEIEVMETNDFRQFSITCSAGFAKLPQDGNNFHEVVEHAEFALAMGKSEISYMMGYDAIMHEEIMNQSEMEKELANAIEMRHLQLYYQPKVDLKDPEKHIMGAEALIRWIKPDGTMISPNVFIPIAEKTGMISKISNFVLCEAVEQTAKWQKMGLSPIVMSINFASGDFYQADVCDVVMEQLNKFGLEPKWLELELTERLALGDINYTVQQMNSLREKGILLAMDDFGTGYSSLSYIQLLPLTLLKLDRSFIIEIETDKVAQEIVSAVIKIARSMEIETIAEGVEYEGQSKILERMGCDYIQGYLYGKPMNARDFEKRLEINTYGEEQA